MTGPGGHGQPPLQCDASRRERIRVYLARQAALERERAKVPRLPTTRSDGLYIAGCMALIAAILIFLMFAACRVASSPLLHDHDQPERLQAEVGDEW